jgi:biotin carboxyl carrier protein
MQPDARLQWKTRVFAIIVILSNAFGNFSLHFQQQCVADILIERGRVGVACGGAHHRDAAAGAFMQAERVGRTGKLEIDQMETIRNHEPDRSRQLFGDVLQPQPDQVAQLQPPHHRGAHRHRARTDTVFLVARQIDELAHPGQRMGQARHRRSRQTAAIGNFQVAEPHLMAFEAAQYIESARHHLNDVSLTCKIAGEHSLFAEPLRASSHVVPRSNSAMRNKIPLADQATSGNLRPQAEGARPSFARIAIFARISIAIRAEAVPENGMPDIKIVTEVAGRVCALPVEIGGSVGDGDDIVFVEAMKMEIPVAAPAAGKLKSILVSLDDVVAEGQVLAILET